MEVERSRFEKLLTQMGGAQIEAWLNTKLYDAANSVLPASIVPSLARDAQRDLTWVLEAADQARRSGNPFTAYAHCLCRVE